MIKAVIFDMGGTLEYLYNTSETRLNNAKTLLAYMKRHGIKLDCDPADFSEKVIRAYEEYKKVSDKRGVELTPFEVWDRYRLREYPEVDRHILQAISERLTHIWETTFHHRELRPHAKKMLVKLKRSGYRLGVISNTPSFVQVFWTLKNYKLIDFFDYVGLSSLHGLKKPDPVLFRIAAADLDVKPEECAYVGDRIDKDVAGARGAGYGMTFRIDPSFLKEQKQGEQKQGGERDADYVIRDLIEIVKILKKNCKKE